jgi:hypothetical protein
MQEFIFCGYSDHEKGLVEVPVIQENVSVQVLTLAIFFCCHVEDTPDVTQASHVSVVLHTTASLLHFNYQVQCDFWIRIIIILRSLKFRIGFIREEFVAYSFYICEF